MKRLLAVALLLLAPVAVAHHPGSVHGLSAYEPITQQLVHRLPDVQASFEAWEAQWPELVDRQVIGTSGTLGLPLEAVRITDESVDASGAATSVERKWRIYLDGGHHGNEFLGVDLVMYQLEAILDSHATDPSFLQTHEVWATPIINPEGNGLDTRKNANQVDPNRNYAYEWGGPGSGGMITDLNYRGPEPFSEPETAANAAFARAIMPDLWITMHTGVAEFYWPWGWTFDPAPDVDFFESLEEPFERATNGRVDAMVAAELYLAAGATDDWGYGQLGVPTHTFEVHEDQFVPVYGEGVPAQIQEQLDGLTWLMEHTGRMGAVMNLHERNGTFHVYNEGWGRAENITVTWDGGAFIIPRLEPGEMHIFDPAPADAFTVRYRQLLIDAPEAQDRVATYTMQERAKAEAPSEESPAVPIALLLAGLVLLARRR